MSFESSVLIAIGVNIVDSTRDSIHLQKAKYTAPMMRPYETM
jgi:hypothetical protein